MAYVFEAETDLNIQALACLEGIVDIEGERLVGHVANRRSVVLAVTRDIAHNEVGGWIIRGAQWFSGDEIVLYRSAIAEAVQSTVRGLGRALNVADVFRVNSYLERIVSEDLSGSVGEGGHLFANEIVPT